MKFVKSISTLKIDHFKMVMQLYTGMLKLGLFQVGFLNLALGKEGANLPLQCFLIGSYWKQVILHKGSLITIIPKQICLHEEFFNVGITYSPGD